MTSSGLSEVGLYSGEAPADNVTLQAGLITLACISSAQLTLCVSTKNGLFKRVPHYKKV